MHVCSIITMIKCSVVASVFPCSDAQWMNLCRVPCPCVGVRWVGRAAGQAGGEAAGAGGQSTQVTDPVHRPSSPVGTDEDVVAGRKLSSSRVLPPVLFEHRLLFNGQITRFDLTVLWLGTFTVYTTLFCLVNGRCQSQWNVSIWEPKARISQGMKWFKR